MTIKRSPGQRFASRVMTAFGLFLQLHFMVSGTAVASFDTKKGARPLGMGGAFVAHANTGDAVYYNPAGLWQIDCFHAQMFYSAPFNMSELNTLTANATYPAGFGNMTANFETYGFDLYRETSFGAAFSQSFRKKLVYGILISYHHLYIKNGGSSGAAGIDAGLMFKPHDHLTLGFYTRNLNRPRIAREPLPVVFAAGLSYSGIEKLRINLDAHKDIKFKADLRMGIEYQLIRQLFLRSGVSSEPSRFSAGFGFDFGSGVIDYAFYTTPGLGVTHAVSTSFYLNRQPDKKIRSSNK